MAEPSPLVPHSDITGLLQQAAAGSREAFDSLMPLVYGELRGMAQHRLRAEPAGHTLNTTALVHEAWLRLVDQTRVAWNDRHHFYGVASEAMRRILVDYARRHRAAKRGANAPHFPLDAVADLVPDVGFLTDSLAEELVSLDEALERLTIFNPQGAKIVQLRFFGGLSNPEIAGLLGTSERTVRRAWMVAKSWLHHELGGSLRPDGLALLNTDQLSNENNSTLSGLVLPEDV
jgi:RNA polymerase sigma factor (TIGR02999 family)